MASILDNSYFYISIFSSMCFVASEILPFLPSKSNGILHAVLLFLANYNKVGNNKKESNENNSKEEVEEEKEVKSELTQKIEQIEKEQENQKSVNENILQELNDISSKIDKIIKPGASLNDTC
jgi:hypothetical protein